MTERFLTAPLCILLTRTLPLRGNVINLGKFTHFP